MTEMEHVTVVIGQLDCYCKCEIYSFNSSKLMAFKYVGEPIFPKEPEPPQIMKFGKPVSMSVHIYHA